MRRSGAGWSGELADEGPVQGKGVADGLPWYFRARHDTWSFSLAEAADADAVDVGATVAGWGTTHVWGHRSDASSMPDETAWELIERCIHDHRAGTLPRIERIRTPTPLTRLSEAEDLIERALRSTMPLMKAAFAAVGDVPPPGHPLDQFGLRDGDRTVREYLQAGEPRLALEHLVYMVREGQLPVAPELAALIDGVASKLGLAPGSWRR